MTADIAISSNVTLRAWRPLEGGGIELVQESRTHNLIVASGLDYIRDMLEGVVPRPDTIKVGTGSTAVLSTNTDLETSVFSKVISRRYPEAAKITYQMLMETSEGNGNTIAEVGLFGSSTLIARAVISPTIAKTSAILLTVAHEITIANG